MTTPASDPRPAEPDFTPDEQAAFYRLAAARRDMRHFIAGARVDEAVLRRLLEAAHRAPSVGLMQPWRFVRIVDAGLRASASPAWWSRSASARPRRSARAARLS